MKVRSPIIPNWSTTMLAGMLVTKPRNEQNISINNVNNDCTTVGHVDTKIVHFPII